MEWVIPVALAGAAAWLVWRSRRTRPRYLARTEFWVYLPEARLPNQDALMTRMVADNPHSRPGRACIGAAEGMLFSDVRTHLGLARRDRNPTLFRPDLFIDRAEPTAAVLASLALAQGMARVRYVSEQPLRDKRHIQFAAHMAGAVLGLADGVAVFDPVAERLYSRESFEGILDAEVDATRFEASVRVSWTPEEEGGRAVTRGLRKIGLAELETLPSPSDQRVLVMELLETLARAAWSEMAVPGQFEAEAFGDRFLFQVEAKGDVGQVAIRRVLPQG